MLYFNESQFLLRLIHAEPKYILSHPPFFVIILPQACILCYIIDEVVAMRVVCFGDSNTYGYDPRGFFGDRYHAEDRWPELLAKETGWEVINLGENGREIPRGCAPIHLLEEYATVDIILIMLGTNDLLQGATAAKAAGRMEAFLSGLLPHCKNILLVAPPPLMRGAWVGTDDLVNESHSLIEEYQLLAAKKHIPFIDTRNWEIGLCFDGVHFTEAGHHAFAKHLAEYWI